MHLLNVSEVLPPRGKMSLSLEAKRHSPIENSHDFSCNLKTALSLLAASLNFTVTLPLTQNETDVSPWKCTLFSKHMILFVDKVVQYQAVP
jgi:hypothetical protein